MSDKLYRGNLTAEQYIDYLRKEVVECNRFHKKIIVNLEKQLKDSEEIISVIIKSESTIVLINKALEYFKKYKV